MEHTIAIDVQDVIIENANFEEKKEIITAIFDSFCKNETTEFLSEFLPKVNEDYNDQKEDYLSHIKF